MLKKKAIVMVGAFVVTVSLLAGVTYAWFTSTQTGLIGQVTAGKLGIAFEVDPGATETPPLPLYPQLTLVDQETDLEYPDESGLIKDVATTAFTLTNDSDRQVLVRINGVDLLKESIMGSDVDGKGNAIAGSYPTLLTDTSAVKISYDFGDMTEVYRNGNNAYVFLPTQTASKTITVKVWIDGTNSDNTYQLATIALQDLTATAVQYREAAIRATFPELDDDIVIENVKFVPFE